VITEKYTEDVEAMIKSRCKDALWDDVVRKEAPVEGAKVVGELDYEKSKQGLAEVYAEKVGCDGCVSEVAVRGAGAWGFDE
jgi:U3 small nucleolar ribonucleoprotein component